MGALMRFVIILLTLVILSGCSIAAHSVKDVDKHIMDISKNSASADCLAGFYSGVAFGTDNLKINRAVVELETLADKESKDYKRCKAKGLEVSILAISGKENLDEAIKRVMSMGLF
jgi:hypothetical protein